MQIHPVTVQEMAEIDRLMIEVYQISLIQMMENAGRNLSDLALKITSHCTQPAFVVFCGSGNNGGGGLVAARHLINRGYPVDIILTGEEKKFKEVPQHQLSILKIMGIKPTNNPKFGQYALIIDAMIGYGLKGAPRGVSSRWIEAINAAHIPILSLDVPSGLDATRGIPFSPCTKAKATMTLALPKTGLTTPEAKAYVGDLYLADISVPKSLYVQLGLPVGDIFKNSPLIKLA